MNLSRQAEPLYQQIADQLRSEIGRYEAGQLLEGELKLAQRFQVNRHTVRRALELLVQEGLVKRSQGKSTEIVETPLKYGISENSAYSDWFTSHGCSSTARMLRKSHRSATLYEQQHLALSMHDEVIEITTLRHIQNEAVSLIRHCFSPDHARLVRDYRQGSMRHYLRGKGVELSRVVSLIGARLPTNVEARHLAMTVDKPVLTVQTLSKNQHGQIVEVAYSTSRADRFQYQIYV